MNDKSEPAFTFVVVGGVDQMSMGLSKREIYALHAMQGMRTHWAFGIIGQIFPTQTARNAFEQADKMLIEGAK